MWAEAVKGTACPQPRRGHVLEGGEGPRPLTSCPRSAQGALHNPENIFTQG